MADSNDLTALEAALLAEIGGAGDLRALEEVRIGALGKKGRVSELMATLGKMPADQRKAFGQAVNGLKDRVSQALEGRKADLERQTLSARLATERADVTLPVRLGPLQDGRIHPVSQVWDEVAEIFGDMGFCRRRGARHRDRRSQLHQAQHPAGAPGAAGPRHVLYAHAAGRQRSAAWCCARTPAPCRSAP